MVLQLTPNYQTLLRRAFANYLDKSQAQINSRVFCRHNALAIDGTHTTYLTFAYAGCVTMNNQQADNKKHENHTRETHEKMDSPAPRPTIGSTVNRKEPNTENEASRKRSAGNPSPLGTSPGGKRRRVPRRPASYLCGRRSRQSGDGEPWARVGSGGAHLTLRASAQTIKHRLLAAGTPWSAGEEIALDYYHNAMKLTTRGFAICDTTGAKAKNCHKNVR